MRQRATPLITLLADMDEMKATWDEIRDHSGGSRRRREAGSGLICYLEPHWLQHSGLLGDEIGVRVARRRRQVQRRHEGVVEGRGQYRRETARNARAVPADHRRREVHAGEPLQRQQLLGVWSDQISRMTDTASAMGQAFDASRGGDYSDLRPETSTTRLRRGLKLSCRRTARRALHHHPRHGPGTPAGILRSSRNWPPCIKR